MDTQIDILILFADQIEVPSSIFTSILFTKTESFDCHFGHLDWLGRRRQIGKKTENEISQQAEYECDLCSYLPPFPIRIFNIIQHFPIKHLRSFIRG